MRVHGTVPAAVVLSAQDSSHLKKQKKLRMYSSSCGLRTIQFEQLRWVIRQLCARDTSAHKLPEEGGSIDRRG